jgi:hypothetical protein
LRSENGQLKEKIATLLAQLEQWKVGLGSMAQSNQPTSGGPAFPDEFDFPTHFFSEGE